MTTAVCRAAHILGMREELLNELLTLIDMTSGSAPVRQTTELSMIERAFMMDRLIDEYSKKL